MTRVTLPKDKSKVLLNTKLKPEERKRLAVICSRRSVQRMEKVSVSDWIVEHMEKENLPKRPTDEQVEEYMRKYPKAKLELDLEE